MITSVKYVKSCCKQKSNRLLCIPIEDRVSSKWQERDLGLTAGYKNLMVRIMRLSNFSKLPREFKQSPSLV